MSPEWLTVLMFGGLLVGLFMGHPLPFVLGGIAVIAGFLGPGPQVFGIIVNRIYGGVMDNYVLVAIPLFILMARFLSDSGVTDRMFETLRLALARIRGGLTLAVVVVSVLLAATTGIVGASITVMGMIALRPMLEYGYQKELSTGTVMASGTLGILIPPSIMLVLMASYSPLSVGELFAGSLVPGLLLGLAYALYVVLIATFRPDWAPPAASEELAAVGRAEVAGRLLRHVLPPITLILGVLGALFTGVATATEASAIGAFLAFVLMVIYGQFTLRRFAVSLFETGKVTAMVLWVIVGATAFTGVFNTGGGMGMVQDALIGSGLPPAMLILTMLLIVFVLGMFLDWTGIVLLSFPIMLPVIEAMEMDPLWFVVMMAVMLQTSFLTPPFGYSLFYLKGVAPAEVGTLHLYRGIIPFVLIILAIIGMMALFPGLVTWLPNRLFG
ncbi:C4-dicarboxylate TRAP transporter large permease protein DctM [wastewater metagenome]|uniref:C4-dicarboxylate TRAP transporter large permease protein DctM n=2 Tax=unclassified sequences TaxID=12908 RepID=A0A5B8RIC3_9ZZZZ|nr:TRAP transporter large permease subunit [Arhodomonas sp. KWT]QEA07422.1 C4-dicarboxylate TRAP transporter large permease protein DctM [uncultured organism]